MYFAAVFQSCCDGRVNITNLLVKRTDTYSDVRSVVVLCYVYQKHID